MNGTASESNTASEFSKDCHSALDAESSGKFDRHSALDAESSGKFADSLQVLHDDLRVTANQDSLCTQSGVSRVDCGEERPVSPFVPVSSPASRPHLAGVTHVYTDLDGTLLAPGGRLLTTHAGEPSAALAEALVALKGAGIEVIIVTGRNGSQGNELLRILNLQTFIGELGCLVMEGSGAGRTISYETGDWADVVLADGLAPGVLPEGETPYRLILGSGVVARLLAAFPGKLEPFVDLEERKISYPFRGFIDVAAASEILADERLPLMLVDNGQIHPKEHTLVDCPEIHIYHLVPSGTSKAAAVAADMARRGLSQEATISVGDSRSDVAMGGPTGSFVAVANALSSTLVQSALAEHAAQGGVTLFTEAPTADGWVEFAHALLAAK